MKFNVQNHCRKLGKNYFACIKHKHLSRVESIHEGDKNNSFRRNVSSQVHPTRIISLCMHCVRNKNAKKWQQYKSESVIYFCGTTSARNEFGANPSKWFNELRSRHKAITHTRSCILACTIQMTMAIYQDLREVAEKGRSRKYPRCWNKRQCLFEKTGSWERLKRKSLGFWPDRETALENHD